MTTVETRNLLRLKGISQRSSTWRFELLDHTLNTIGELHPEQDPAPTITNDTTRAVMRTMESFTLPPGEWEDIDFFTNRVRPVMVLENGVDLPQGVFVWMDPNRTNIGSTVGSGKVAACTLQDLGNILEQPVPYPVSAFPGNGVDDVMAYVLVGLTGLPPVVMGSTNVVIGAPLSWSTSTSRTQILTDLATLAGWSPPWFDNTGQLHLEPVEPLETQTPDPTLVYEDGLNIVAGSIVESDNKTTLPNIYLVVDTSGSGNQVRGTWAVPDSCPWSTQNRGYDVTLSKDVQGLSNADSAAAAAKAWGTHDSTGWTEVQFDSAPNAMHDHYDVVLFQGVSYRETQWTMELREGGRMSHTIGRTITEAFQ